MDMSRRLALSDPDRWEVASDLHGLLLEETFEATEWTQESAVFHGGTSLHLAHNSGRYSEDLDFLVVGSKLGKLVSSLPGIVAKTQFRILEKIPDSTLAHRVKFNENPVDTMVTVKVRWSHPMRMGNVLVKLEFYAVKGENLIGYGAQPVLRLPGLDRVRLKVQVPVPPLSALWGDKVKAMATRTVFKWRDVYDLGFIAEEFDRMGRPSRDVLIKALMISTAIYEKNSTDILDGLTALVNQNVFLCMDDFTADMKRWFPHEMHASMVRTGTFRRMIDAAQAEVLTAIGMLRAAPATKPILFAPCRPASL